MAYELPPDIPRIIDHVQRAPSIFNTRPWWFEPRPPDRIELWLRGSQGEPHGVAQARVARARAREYVISCGAALFDLRMTIRMAGHDLAVWLLPDPEHADPVRPPTLLALVEIVTGRVKKPSIAEQELYEAIERRHTNRQPYKIVPVPLPIMAAMEGAAWQEGAYLRLLHPSQARSWMRESARVSRDPASFQNLVKANYGPHPKNHYPPTREDFWNSDKRTFERKPQLMALSTDDDEPVDWLRAGQALQHALLTGTRYSVSARHGMAARYHAPHRYGVPARRHLLRHDELAPYGLSASFLTQLLERDDVNGEPRRWRGRWHYPDLPQMIIRVGYAVDQAKEEKPPKTSMGANVPQPPWQVPPGARVGPDSPQP
jgi:hypothetical protein